MVRLERGEGRTRRERPVADEAMDAHGSRLALDPDEVELEEREPRCSRRGALADHDVEVVGLRLRFEARGQVYVVAQHRIVEAMLRAHVADAAHAGVEADADTDVGEGLALGLGLAAPNRIEPRELVAHGKCGQAGVLGVRRVVERGIPKRHDGIAHVLVDGAARRQDQVAHRREEAVDEARQPLGIEALREGGEAADVAEHERHLAHRAAELEPLGMARELLDDGGCEIAAERDAHAPALGLGAQEQRRRGREVDEEYDDRGEDRVDQQLVGGKGVPGDGERRCHGGQAQYCAPARAGLG